MAFVVHTDASPIKTWDNHNICTMLHMAPVTYWQCTYCIRSLVEANSSGAAPHQHWK